MQEFICKDRVPQVLFALCERCFWTASLIGPVKSDPYLCPACSVELALIPITQSESYRYEVSEKRGLEMSFSTRHGPHAA